MISTVLLDFISSSYFTTRANFHFECVHMLFRWSCTFLQFAVLFTPCFFMNSLLAQYIYVMTPHLLFTLVACVLFAVSAWVVHVDGNRKMFAFFCTQVMQVLYWFYASVSRIHDAHKINMKCCLKSDIFYFLCVKLDKFLAYT